MTYIDHFRRRWPAPNHCPASAPSANRSSTRTACGEHPRRSRRRLVSTLRELIGVAALCALASGCTVPSAAPPSTPTAARVPAPAQTTGQPSPRPLDPQQVQRLQQIMVPLVRAMDRPPSLNQVKVGILADPHINAVSAGGAEFYVTTGFLQKANDAQLAGVLAHELAHDATSVTSPRRRRWALACPSAWSSWIKSCLAAAL
jgi:hypothetical protein